MNHLQQPTTCPYHLVSEPTTMTNDQRLRRLEQQVESLSKDQEKMLMQLSEMFNLIQMREGSGSSSRGHFREGSSGGTTIQFRQKLVKLDLHRLDGLEAPTPWACNNFLSDKLIEFDTIDQQLVVTQVSEVEKDRVERQAEMRGNLEELQRKSTLSELAEGECIKEVKEKVTTAAIENEDLRAVDGIIKIKGVGFKLDVNWAVLGWIGSQGPESIQKTFQNPAKPSIEFLALFLCQFDSRHHLKDLLVVDGPTADETISLTRPARWPPPAMRLQVFIGASNTPSGSIAEITHGVLLPAYQSIYDLWSSLLAVEKNYANHPKSDEYLSKAPKSKQKDGRHSAEVVLSLVSLELSETKKRKREDYCGERNKVVTRSKAKAGKGKVDDGTKKKKGVCSTTVIYDGGEFAVGDDAYVMRREDASSNDEDPEVEECRICFKAGRHVMIKCDGCLGGLHLKCWKPPLKGVPEGEWVCTFYEARKLGKEIELPKPPEGKKRTKTLREKLFSSNLWPAHIESLWKEVDRNYWSRVYWYMISEETSARRQPHDARRDDFFLCECEYDIHWHNFKRIAEIDNEEHVDGANSDEGHFLWKLHPKSKWYLTVLDSLAITQREYVTSHAFCRNSQMQIAINIPEHYPKYEHQTTIMPECFAQNLFDHLHRTFNGPVMVAIQWVAIHTVAGNSGGIPKSPWPFTLVQEPGSHVGEVAKEMGKNKVLVKVHPEGKYITDIDILSIFPLLTAKPILYLVNMNEKDYQQKKNKFLPKIHAWVQEHGYEAIISFSYVLERHLVDMLPDEAAKYYEGNKQAGPEEVQCRQIRMQKAGSGYTTYTLIKKVMEASEWMGKGVKANANCFYTLFELCGDGKSLENGKKVHDYFLQSTCRGDLALSNKVIEMFGKCGSMNNARRVCDNMPDRTMDSWHLMINTYAVSGLEDESLLLFERVQKLGLEPDEQIFPTVYSDYGSADTSEEGF